MKLLKASWLITSNTHDTIIKDGAVVFDEKICCVGHIDDVKKKYSNLVIEDLGENSVLLPGLINSHVHLEFSSNTTTLKYGNFMSWLHSVIENRDELVEKATSELISNKLEDMLRSGTTTIGAISSYSYDLSSCVETPMNTVFFSEVIGSKGEMVDTLFADFKSRLNEAKKYESKNFIPAVAIHSPYSVHPFLVRESLKLASEDNLCVSAHFLESPEENEWLHKDEGGFLSFFQNFLGQKTAVTKPLEFLNQFKNIKNLSFTHCVEASKQDLNKIKELDAVINHCPTSNRLLNNNKLKIDDLGDIPFSIGTDGLSSNISLNLFDELRTALLIHTKYEINLFAKKLIKSATKNGALALGLQKGELSEGFDADIISVKLPNSVNEENVCMHTILHTKTVQSTYIGGQNV